MNNNRNGIPRPDIKRITPEEAERIRMRSRRQKPNPAKVAGSDAKRKKDTSDQPKPNRWRELSQIRDEILPILSQSEALTLLIIWSMADARTRVAKVSKTAIENRSSMSRTTIKRAIRSLIKRELLKVVRRGTVGGQSNYYLYQNLDQNLGSQ